MARIAAERGQRGYGSVAAIGADHGVAERSFSIGDAQHDAAADPRSPRHPAPAAVLVHDVAGHDAGLDADSGAIADLALDAVNALNAGRGRPRPVFS
jgi:hypothetical protein